MHVRILAFDPGTANMGFATLSGFVSPQSDTMPQLTNDWGILHTNVSEGDVRTRIDALGDGMAQLIERIQPTHVAIEDFTEQGKRVGKTYKEMAWLTEHLRMVGRALNYDIAIYENGYWKRKTLGIRGATKVQVQHFLRHHVQGSEALIHLPKNKNHIWDSVGVGYCLYTELKGAVIQ